jgi:hypothetical protein
LAVLLRVGVIMLAVLALEMLVSAGWFLLHGSDRRVLQEVGLGIEETSQRLDVERAWLTDRARLDETIDSLAARLSGGRGSFATEAGYDSARSRQVRGVEEWNAGIDIHEARAAAADSLAALHDSLVAVYQAAYRRAFPSWVLMPRPTPPAQSSGG